MLLLRTRAYRTNSRLGWMFCALVSFVLLSGISECSSSDADGDGYTTQDGDCDDTDSAIYPYAAERCDGVDSNCDDLDEPYRTFFLDQDLDGWGDSTQAVEACQQPSGTNTRGGDCDDGDPMRFPTHEESCNGIDDDCNGLLDDGLGASFYRDADGDGFGSLNDVSCGTKAGYISVRGDCDDSRKDVYPGATDALGDGRDQDCGGMDGPQPQLGFGKNPVANLQAALDSATSGATVWVGPGEYVVSNVQFPPHNLRLMSTHGRDMTSLNAHQQGRILSISSGNGAETLIDGFTLKNGSVSAQNGGAMRIQNSSPTLNQLSFVSNQASSVSGQYSLGNGGALALENSASILKDIAFSHNISAPLSPPDDCCGGHGGAIYVSGGTPRFYGVRADNNHGYEGGALYGVSTSLELRTMDFGRNIADSRGHSIFLEQATLALYGGSLYEHDRTVNNNLVFYADASMVTVADLTYTGNDGTFMVNDGMARITDSRFVGNHDTALYLSVGWQVNNSGFPPSVLRHNKFLSNIGSGDVGIAALLLNGFIGVEFNTFAGNSYRQLGSLYIQSGSCQLDSNLFSDNIGYDIDFFPERASLPYLIFNNFYNTTSDISPRPLEMDTSNTRQEPHFVAWSNNDNTLDDDVHLLPTSALQNGGNPAFEDWDGSRAQVGAYGADALPDAYARDGDGDGLYDGWEETYGLNPLLNDANLDQDGDGVTNQAEFLASLIPANPDTDGDGQSDGLEVRVGSDPRDWFQRVSEDGIGIVEAIALVPEDFPTLKAAINAVHLKGEIQLQSGTWQEQLQILGKNVTIRGTTNTILTLSPTEYGTILEGRLATVGLSDLIFQDSNAQQVWEFFWFERSTASLDRVVGRNKAMTMTYAGGAHLSALSLLDVTIRDNAGSGLYFEGCSVDFDGLQLIQNQAVGLSFQGDGNTLTGAHLFATGHNLQALQLRGVSGQMDYIAVVNNPSSQDGSIQIQDSDIVLSHAVVVGNGIASALSGGIVSMGSPSNTFTLENSIVAYNAINNLLVAGPMASISYSNLYNPSGAENTTGVPPSATMTTIEPQFLSYGGNGLPSDFHLAVDSPLVNAGVVGQSDADASRCDLGMYGGADGDLWDRDGDAFEDYFWPGSRAQSPKGFSATEWDLNDADATVH